MTIYFHYSTLSKASLCLYSPSTQYPYLKVWCVTCVCVCACVSEPIYLLQRPPSLVQQGLIYAVAVAILWRMLQWHHSSALTPVCSLTLPLPADSSTPGMIYQALKQQTKAPRNVCRARDGLIDKHCDSRTKHERGSTS